MPDAFAPPESDEPLISIGVLAERVGLSVSTVRKYEHDGLLIAHRTRSGRRLFSHEDIGRVRNIQHLIQDLGLNVEGIRRLQAMLPCWEVYGCEELQRDRCAAFGERARPCWTIKGVDCAPQGNECRRCAVYRFGTLFTEHTKELTHPGAGPSHARAVIRDFLDGKGRS